MYVYEAHGTTHSPHCSGNYNLKATRAAFPLSGLLYFLFHPSSLFFPLSRCVCVAACRIRYELDGSVKGNICNSGCCHRPHLTARAWHVHQARSQCVSVCVCSSVARLPDLKSQAASSETARKAATAAVSPQGLQFNWNLPGEEKRQEAMGWNRGGGRERGREERWQCCLPSYTLAVTTLCSV